MNYKTYDSIKSKISGFNYDILKVKETMKNIDDLIQVGWLNPSEMTNTLEDELQSILKDIDKCIEEENEKIISYNFLNHHISMDEDSVRWLGMNSETIISTSYSCPHCDNRNNHKDEHICATELVSPSIEEFDGALFLEKLKCSSCNDEFIIENGV